MSVPERGTKVDTSPERLKAVPLVNRVSGDASAADVSAAVVAIWQDVDRSLRPVIGERGVAALFNRCCHLMVATYPWLAPCRPDPAAAMDLPALQAQLAQQPAEDAMACGNAMLQSFQRLLSSLVGPLLTERLLRSAWNAPSPESATRDSPP